MSKHKACLYKFTLLCKQFFKKCGKVNDKKWHSFWQEELTEVNIVWKLPRRVGVIREPGPGRGFMSLSPTMLPSLWGRGTAQHRKSFHCCLSDTRQGWDTEAQNHFSLIASPTQNEITNFNRQSRDPFFKSHKHWMHSYACTYTYCGVLMLIKRLMVSKMATTCRRASSQTAWTRWRHRSLKRTAWLRRLEEGRRWMGTFVCHASTCLKVFVVKSNWILVFTEKPLTGPFPLSLQCFLLRDAPPVGPCFSLWIWYMALFPHSLSLIMKQTARRRHRDITYSWGTCRIITVRVKNTFWIFSRLFGWLRDVLINMGETVFWWLLTFYSQSKDGCKMDHL